MGWGGRGERVRREESEKEDGGVSNRHVSNRDSGDVAAMQRGSRETAAAGRRRGIRRA